MVAQEREALWTFERFEKGQRFGTVELVMDDQRRGNWRRVFGETSQRLPKGMMVTAMMEAYIHAIQPRPDGNVHASQELTFNETTATWGDTLSITVSCAGKEEKKGRYWVQFAIEAKAAGKTVMTGTIRSIWAA